MCAAAVPCRLGLWCRTWDGFEQRWPELLGGFFSFHHLCGWLQRWTAWKDRNPSNPLDLGEGGSRVTGQPHPAERSSKLRRAVRVYALLLLTDCWSRAEYTFCSVSARSRVDVVFNPGCVMSGLVPLKRLSFRTRGQNSPGVHSAVLPRLVAYLSGSQTDLRICFYPALNLNIIWLISCSDTCCFFSLGLF